MRLRSAGLLSVALCLWLISGSVLSGLDAVLPFACVMDMVLIGLFLPLLPRFEAVALYLFAAGWDIAETMVEVPYMRARYIVLVEVAKQAATTPVPPLTEFFTIPEILMQALIILLTGFIVVTIISLVKSLLSLGKTMIMVLMVSTAGLFLGMIWIASPVLYSGQTPLNVPSLVVADMLVNILVFFSAYLVLTSPFLAVAFFRWLGVYRRVPALWGNS